MNHCLGVWKTLHKIQAGLLISLCDKDIPNRFLSKKVLESGVYSSVLAYNDGFVSFKNVFKKLDI